MGPRTNPPWADPPPRIRQVQTVSPGRDSCLGCVPPSRPKTLSWSWKKVGPISPILLTIPDNGYILDGMTPPIFLKEWRTSKGFSYRQLAQGSGVALSGIQEIEAGSRSPTVATLDKLAKGLGVDFHDLFKKPRKRNKPRTGREG